MCDGVLQCVAVCYNLLQCTREIDEMPAVMPVMHRYINVVQCVSVCCSVLRCVAVWYSLLQCTTETDGMLGVMSIMYRCISVIQCVAVRCSVLRCSVLPCVAVCFSALQRRM